MKKFLLILSVTALFFAGCKEPVPEGPKEFKVTFDANGGTGYMDVQKFTEGVAQPLSSNMFSREGYDFSGWSESKEAAEIQFKNEEQFTATKDVTLYAVWAERKFGFVSVEADNVLTITLYGSMGVPEGLEFSADGKTWKAVTKDGENSQIKIPFGSENKLYLRGNSSIGTATSKDNYINFGFKEGTQVSATGDIRILVDHDNSTEANTSNARFCRLFESCNALGTPPELGSATLADYCYYGMFSDCENLSSAPMLPAMELKPYCYYTMFLKCSNLYVTPTLPAKTLADYCYQNMFVLCTKLNSITMLATKVDATECLKGWLTGTSGGTLTVATDMSENDIINKDVPKTWDIVESTN